METGGLLKLFVKNSLFGHFMDYLKERILTFPILLLITAMAMGSYALSLDWNPALIFIRFVLLVTLIIVFRLWDDLADRRYDAEFHPKRVTVKIKNITIPGILVSLIFAGVLFIFWLLGEYEKIQVLIVFLLILAVFYSISAENPAFRIIKNQFVLLKYPLILFAASSSLVNINYWTLSILIYIALTLFDLKDFFVSTGYKYFVTLYFLTAGGLICIRICSIQLQQ
jgi:hypothetical protein